MSDLSVGAMEKSISKPGESAALFDEYQKIEHILENNDYILVSVSLDCIFFFFSVKNGRKALKYFFHNVAAPKILVGLLPCIQPVLLMGCGCEHPFRSFKN